MRFAGSRADRAVATAVAVAAVLRVVASIGQRAIIYVDSIDYEHIDLWGGRRPWVTPLLYEVFDGHDGRVLVQALIGAACWSYLALTAMALVEDRRARWCALLGVLGLSLTTAVTSWDTALLSESLALSLGALLLGVLLRFARAPSLPAALALVAVWVLWLFTRQAHLILSVLGVAVLLAVCAVAARRRSRSSLPLLAVLAGVAAATLLAGWSFSQDTDIVHANLTDVIGRRIFPDDDAVAWMTDHGMPVPEGAVPGEPVPLDVLRDDAGFRAWLEEDGVGDYARLLLSRPWQSVSRPFSAMVSERAPFGDLDRPDDVLLAMPEAYGVAREVLPAPVEDLLFDPGQAGIVLLGAAVALGATAHRWSARGADRRWIVPLVVLAVQWPALVLVWHTSTAELGRLSLPSALLVRLALLLQLALLADAWWTERARPDPLASGTAA